MIKKKKTQKTKERKLKAVRRNIRNIVLIKLSGGLLKSERICPLIHFFECHLYHHHPSIYKYIYIDKWRWSNKLMRYRGMWVRERDICDVKIEQCNEQQSPLTKSNIFISYFKNEWFPKERHEERKK